MNKSFKVVFSKARGALMVANELTSSVQAKGTKTVIAAAVTALMAGGAMAAIPEAPTGGDTVKISDKAIGWNEVKAQNVFNSKFENAGGSFFLAADATGSNIFSKTLWVKLVENGKYATGLWAADARTVTNAGTIYVQGTDAEPWKVHGMGAAGNGKAVNKGTIIAENAYGMFVGTADQAGAPATIINEGRIEVHTQGVGMEVGNQIDKSAAINRGTIVVGDVATGKFGHGVLVKDQTGSFTNSGTIVAGEGATAIEVQSDKAATVANVTLEAGSNIDGDINVVKKGAQNVTLNLTAKGVVDTFGLKAAKDTEGVTVNLTIEDGANITLEDGKAAEIDVADINNGTLNASIWQSDNAFKQVTVGDQGTFNITKLNSRTDDVPAEGANNRILLAFGTDYGLDGGRLQVAGQDYHGALKIGSSDKGAGKLTIYSGDYHFSEIEVAKEGTLNLHGGKLSVDTLKAQMETATEGKIDFDGGTLSTAGSQIFKQSGETWDTTNVVSHMSGTGVLEVTSDAFEYSLAELKAAQKLVNGSDTETLKVVFANGTLTLGQNEALTGDQIGGLNLADKTAEAKDGAFSVSSNTDTTVAAVDFGGKESTTEGTVTITTNGSDTTGALVLSGDNGNVFAGLADTTKTVAVTGTLTLGDSADATGNVNVENLTATMLNVVGTFTADKVNAEAAVIDGDATFKVNELTGGKATVNGDLEVGEVAKDATVEVAEGGMVVLSKVAGTVQAASSGYALTPEGEDALDGAKLYSTNADARSIIAKSFMTDTDVAGKEILFLDDQLTVDPTTGKVAVGGGTATAGAVTIGATGLLIIDARALGAEPLVKGALTAGADSGHLLNLNQTGTFALSTNEVTGLTTFKDDNAFLTATVENVGETDKTSAIKVAFDTTTVNGNDELAAAMEKGFGNAKNGAVFNAIGKNEALFANGTLTDDGEWATEEYIATPVVSGTYNVAYDAAAEVTRSVAKRNVQGEGMGAWADVFYASNEAKKAYGDQGYSADIYGGVFGFDATFSCGAKLGAALTIGQADADSERSFSKFSTDADFYGLSVYTGKAVGDTSLYIGADVSYLWLENDISGTVAGASADESIDSNVFTIGLRADWTAYEGAFNVVPHVGVRYTAIDVDNYRGYESDSMNVVELPIGVKVAGAFEPAAGWKLVPSVDFTVVPQVGDKDVNTDIGTVDVIDNLYNTTVGVEAAYGNYAFGLDAGYGFGNDDRQNATVKANFSYRF